MELYIVRHGQTRANETNTIQGQGDTELNELGLQQAERVAHRLQSVTFNAVYSSDLKRAMVTATTIVPQKTPIASPQLREWDLGDWVGKHRQEVEAKYPETWQGFLLDQPGLMIPGGESRDQVEQRAGAFLEQLATDHAGETVLVVSHCGTIRAMFRHVLNLTAPLPRQPEVANGGICRLRHQEGRWQLATWNDTAHLQGMTSDQGNY